MRSASAVGRQEQMPFLVRQQALADHQMPELPMEAPKRLVAEAAGKLPSAPDHRSLTSAGAIGSPTEPGPSPLTRAPPCLGSLPATLHGRSHSVFKQGKFRAAPEAPAQETDASEKTKSYPLETSRSTRADSV